MRIGVIIVNYNSGALLRKCLEHVSRQTVSPSRVLVLDNASHDGSLVGVEGILPSLQVVRMDHNVGFAKDNNIAADMLADCDWIALLNPDAFPEKKWLQTLMRATVQYPAHDSFASKMLSEQDATIIDGAGDSYKVDGRVWPRFQGMPADVYGLKEEEVFSPCGGAALIRRRVFLDLGGFDVNYFCYHEDVDFGFRMRLRGCRCMYIPNAIVRHVGSASSGKGSDFSVYYAHRNMVWTYVKNMPGRYFWYYLPFHVFVNFASIVLFVMRGRGKVILKAKTDALKSLPVMLSQRRNVQLCRCVNAADIIRAMSPIKYPWRMN